MITTREFFENDADNIILDLETIWSIQRESNKKYINVPFPSKEDFLERYEAGLDDPYDELSDYDNISSEEEQQMIQEQKARISNVYNKIQKEREAFMKTVG